MWLVSNLRTNTFRTNNQESEWARSRPLQCTHSLRDGFVSYAHTRGASDRAIAYQTPPPLPILGRRAYVRIHTACEHRAISADVPAPLETSVGCRATIADYCSRRRNRSNDEARLRSATGHRAVRKRSEAWCPASQADHRETSGRTRTSSGPDSTRYNARARSGAPCHECSRPLWALRLAAVDDRWIGSSTRRVGLRTRGAQQGLSRTIPLSATRRRTGQQAGPSVDGTQYPVDHTYRRVTL